MATEFKRLTLRKGVIMAQAKKKTVVSKTTDKLVSIKTIVPVKEKATLELVNTGTSSDTYFTSEKVWEWINVNANGNLNNVEVVPLDNLQKDKPHPAPFGYNSKNPNGATPTIMNLHIHGVDGNYNLGEILKQSHKVDGHSAKQMRAVVGLLNGGLSRSPCRDKAKYWESVKGTSTSGTSYIKLRSLV